MNDIVSLGFLAGILLLVITVFIRISSRLRRGGGSLTTAVLGSTDAFLTQERSRAAETIVDENAGKKFRQLPSTDPPEKKACRES